MGEGLTERLRFEVQTPKPTGDGLKEVLAQLRAVDKVLDSVHGKLSGQPNLFKKSQKEIADELKRLQVKVSAQTPLDIGKFLGLDERTLKKQFSAAQLAQRGFFANSVQAAKSFARVYEKAFEAVNVGPRALANFLTGGGALSGKVPAHVSAAKVNAVARAEVDGPITLIVPASQIRAVLEGAVTLTVPGSAVSGVATGGGSSTGAGGGTLGTSKGPSLTPPSKSEIERVVKKTRSGITESITEALGEYASQTVTTGPKGGKSTVTRTQRGAQVRGEFRDKLGLEFENSKALVAGSFTGDKAKDLRASAQILNKTAAQIDAVIAGSRADLEATKQAKEVRKAEAKANTLRKQAKAEDTKADAAEKAARAREIALNSRGLADMDRFIKSRDKTRAKQLADDEKAVKSAKAERDKEVRLVGQGRADMDRTTKQQATARKKQLADDQKARTQAGKVEAALANGEFVKFTGARARNAVETAFNAGFRTESTESSIRATKGGNQRRVVTSVAGREAGGFKETIKLVEEFDAKGNLLNVKLGEMSRQLKATRQEAGLAGRDFLKNTLQVSLWAASVGALYGTLGLAQKGFASLVATGLQTARLDQVFTKIGGTTRQLRDEVLRLAGVEGRSSLEALESAVSWSRLGLTRAQVTEGVRVSLRAANVAELDAAEATKKLQAVMIAYSLSVSDLDSVLGQLNQTSNTYNITNKELLEGVSRVSGLAKQAGLGLSELIGLIGATAGATGQSGANIGNAIKSVISSVQNPEIQKFLRNSFKIEATTQGGEDVKQFTDLLQDLFVAYQGMTDAERNWMLVRVANKTQASRFAALLDNYIRSQTLAINAQLNLNSAEVENARIRATLRNQLAGIATEWERLITKQGDNGVVRGMSEVAMAFRNILSIGSTSTGSAVLTGLTTLTAVLSARLILTHLHLQKVAGAGGFAAATTARFMSTLKATNVALDESLLRLRAWWTGLTRMNAAGVTERALRGVGMALYFTGQAAQFAWKSLQVAVLTLARFLPQMLVISGGIWLFNRGMEALGASTEATERKLAGFNAEAQRARSAVGAAAQATKLFDTLGRALPRARRGDQAELINELEEVNVSKETRADLLAAAQAGNFTRVNVLLEKEKSEWIARSAAERTKETIAIVRQRDAIREAIGDFKNNKLAKSWSKAMGNNTLKELQAREAELSGQVVKQYLSDSEENQTAYQDRLASDLRLNIALEQQKLLLESISEIYRSFPTISPIDQHTSEIAALRAQKAVLETEESRLNQGLSASETASRDREGKVSVMMEEARQARELAARNAMALETNPRDTAARTAQKEYEARATELEDAAKQLQSPAGESQRYRDRLEKMAEERRKIEKDLAAKESPEVISAIERRARQQTSLRQAKNESERFDYGDSEAERLQHREAGLRGLIDEKRKERMGIQNDAIAGAGERTARWEALITEEIQHRVDLYETLLDKQRSANRLQAEEKQLMEEKRREFERSLLTAGPNELLRKLTAATIAGGKIDAGKFFSLSPEVREDLLQLRPELSPEMKRIQRAKDAAGAPMSGEAMDAVRQEFEKSLAALKDLLPKQMDVDAQARASLEMSNVAQSAGMLAPLLDALGTSTAAALDKMNRALGIRVGGGAAQPAQSQGVALGSPQPFINVPAGAF